jgi:hypothetical protein
MSIKLSDLANMNKHEQRKIMNQWFNNNFIEALSDEWEENHKGTYCEIDPRTELKSMFSDIVEQHVIEEAAEFLEPECGYKWFLDFEESNYWEDAKPDAYSTFQTSIDRVLEMVDKSHMLGGSNIIQHLFQILYANIFTSFEAYMVRAFINKVFESNQTLEMYLTKQKEFQFENPKLIDILKGPEHLEKITENKKRDIRSELIKASWHDLKKVATRFNNIGISIDLASSGLHKIISIRNDIVHRNSHTMDDIALVISRDNISEAISTVIRIAGNIRAHELGFENLDETGEE